MILTIWLLMKRKLSVGMSMKIWGWYTFAWHQCTISWQWSIGTRICGASLYNNVTSLRWFDTKFDERDACDDAIGWWMLWVHGSIVTSMTPSFCCRIFLRDDFEAGEKKGWDFKQEMKSLKNRRAFEVGFIFFSTCKMCFLFSCLLSLSKVYGGAALRSFRRWVVWCLDSFFFAFWIWFCFLLPFRLCRFRFLSVMTHWQDRTFLSAKNTTDATEWGVPWLFNFSSSPGFSITSIQSGNRGVFGNTVHKPWIMYIDAASGLKARNQTK